eukprot:366260-Chlamydomonas_euryale.AAC.28
MCGASRCVEQAGVWSKQLSLPGHGVHWRSCQRRTTAPPNFTRCYMRVIQLEESMSMALALVAVSLANNALPPTHPPTPRQQLVSVLALEGACSVLKRGDDAMQDHEAAASQRHVRSRRGADRVKRRDELRNDRRQLLLIYVVSNQREAPQRAVDCEAAQQGQVDDQREALQHAIDCEAERQKQQALGSRMLQLLHGAALNGTGMAAALPVHAERNPAGGMRVSIAFRKHAAAGDAAVFWHTLSVPLHGCMARLTLFCAPARLDHAHKIRDEAGPLGGCARAGSCRPAAPAALTAPTPCRRRSRRGAASWRTSSPALAEPPLAATTVTSTGPKPGIADASASIRSAGLRVFDSLDIEPARAASTAAHNASWLPWKEAALVEPPGSPDEREAAMEAAACGEGGVAPASSRTTAAHSKHILGGDAAVSRLVRTRPRPASGWRAAAGASGRVRSFVVP